MTERICSIPDCGKPIFNVTRAMCAMHYSRFQRHGDPLHVKDYGTPEDRFWSYVDRAGDDQCWMWRGPQRGTTDKYGVFASRGVTRSAHRFSLALATGENHGPEMHALHSCDTPLCVNPRHLRWGTQQENMDDLRRKNDQRTHCAKRGHLLAKVGHYHYSDGRRECAGCRAVRKGKWTEHEQPELPLVWTAA